jgi:hypothetical protein
MISTKEGRALEEKYGFDFENMTKKEIDYKVFDNAGDYYLALRAVGSGAPLQMMHGISQLQKREKFSFPEAYEQLLKDGTIIEI